MAMAMPQANISLQGEVPRTLSGKLLTPQKCTASAATNDAFRWYFISFKMCVVLYKSNFPLLNICLQASATVLILQKGYYRLKLLI